MALAPGMTVAPNLRLVRKLGEGSMGAIWVAVHLTLRTQVAIKFIAREVALRDPVITSRFTREATAAAAIKSPHVVRVFDHGFTDDETPYIVMELLEGEDLGKRLERSGRLDCGQVVEIVEQVCKALAKAHDAGIVHRDIKPENIFVTESDGELLVRVLDFGLAKQDEVERMMSLTQTGAFMGTPYYMSPEQVLNAKHVDGRADLWSVGVVAYRALTGRLPFYADSIAKLVVVIDRAAYVRATQVVPDLPRSIDDWFARALSREPADRFGSAKEMAEALRRAVASAPSEDAARQGQSSVTAGSFAVTASEPPTAQAERAAPAAGKLAAIVAVVILGITSGAVATFRLLHAPSSSTTAPATTTTATEPAEPSVQASPPSPPSAATDPSAPATQVVPPAPHGSADATGKPPRAPTTAAAEPKKPRAANSSSCDPPYTFDAKGDRHFKPECFPR